MTTGQGTFAEARFAEADTPDGFVRGWQALREDESIQFAPIAPERVEPTPLPAWLVDVFDWLSASLAPIGRFIVTIWPVLQWVLLAGALALLCLIILRIVQGREWRSEAAKGAAAPALVPEKAAALALLEEADRLAEAGRYSEATHLLLKRSIGQIAQARPDLIAPSSTAREIAEEPALPTNARDAFATIAARVESSLFALRQLSGDDWHAARDAYARFALEEKSFSG